MLQYRTVSPATLELLKGLSKDTHLSDFFLVGGTSLSLQIGHRESYDLDFFSLQAFSTEDMMRHLRIQWESEMLSTSEHILITMTEGVKVDFVVHPYPIRNPLLEVDGLRLLHREDIALMKRPCSIRSEVSHTSTMLKEMLTLFYSRRFLGLL